MIKTSSEARPVEIFPGVVRRTLSHSDRAMLTEMTVRRGAGAEMHKHDNDEICYVVSGRIRLEIGGQTRELGPGDSYCAAGGEDHALHALDDALCIIAFAPLRREYMD